MTIRNYSARNIPAPWLSSPGGGLVARGAVTGPRPKGAAGSDHGRTQVCLRSRVIGLLLAAALAWPAAAAKPAKPSKPKPAARRPAARTVPKAGDLASLVRAWRESPSVAGRAAVESYAAAHARDNTGLLARLALGVGSYEQRDFAAAIASLRKVQGKLPQIADYTAYYLAASRVESNDTNGIGGDLAPARAADPRSPLSGRAWLVEARALKDSGAAEAVRLLREHYSELPQPEGDVTLADCYQAARDLGRAAEYYQRVYYRYLTGDAANRSAGALITLKDTMGAAYPAPSSEQMLQRAGRLVEAREYPRARAEYRTLLDQLAGGPRDQARVRLGELDFLAGNTGAAYAYLRGLELPAAEADAERLYYLAECARRLTDDDEMMDAVHRLGRQYAKSQWRVKALITAANRFLLANRPDDFVPLYQAACEDFPTENGAGMWHWKATFQAYLRGQSDAADRLRRHLRNYPLHPTTGSALYFLGRSYEQAGDPGAARAFYQRLVEAYQNLYYAMRARERLAAPEVARATIPAAAAKFLAELKPPPAAPVPAESTRETAVRIERSRLLRTAGLVDLADGEIRFGARTDGQPALLAMEMAGAADATHVSVRIMKAMVPEYLNLRLDQAPRKFWETLFPLPYRAELMQYTRERDLDPYLLAGLIRQESEFNPQALSHANAYGLTQVLPGTGRQFARKVGISRFNNRMLFQPAANLKIGSSILKSMLDQNGGKLEQTLAAYNAGPARLADWLIWYQYREPAEFVESIPFTETRDYVQAVMRNADIYRRLYR